MTPTDIEQLCLVYPKMPTPQIVQLALEHNKLIGVSTLESLQSYPYAYIFYKMRRLSQVDGGII